MSSSRPIRALAVAAATAAAIVPPALATRGAEHARAPGGPKLVQLSYEVTDGSSGAKYLLSAFSRRTDAVRFKTSHRGRTETAEARYVSRITDTDIRGERASHPWRPIRKRGGRGVLRLIRASLDERGVAQVRLRAARDGRVDRAKVRIVLSECTLDPPLYPASCEVAI